MIFSVVLVLLAASPALLDAAAVNSYPNMDVVFNKMETFAKRNLETSELTYDEMLAASREYRSLTQSQQEELWQDRLKKLAIDFVIYPVGTSHLQLLDSEDLKKKYIKRCEAAYKKFRVAYLGGKLQPGGVCLHPRTTDLGKILILEDQSIPLTKKLLNLAMIERDAWMHKLDDIVKGGDVFAKEEQDEMREIWNYLNHNPYKIIFDHVYPEIRTDADIDRRKLIRIYQLHSRAKLPAYEQRAAAAAMKETKKWYHF